MNAKISNLEQIAYARRYTLNCGKEDGIRVIEVNNGKLRFMLNESKALDVMQMWHKGENISFISKNGFTKREIPFMRRFEGGMIYTCGLDDVGGREGYELHGNFHNSPANVITCDCNEDGITIIAEVLDTQLFGKNLVMRRTITTKILSDEVDICDTLINKGTKAEEYALLYHVNVGYPMLDEGTTITSDAISVTPRNDWSAQNIDDRTVRKAPVDNQMETCYFVVNKTPKIVVENKKINKTFTLTYSDQTLPYFVQWNGGASGDYALGTEVSTTLLDDKFAYKQLSSGESVVFKLNFKLN